MPRLACLRSFIGAIVVVLLLAAGAAAADNLTADQKEVLNLMQLADTFRDINQGTAIDLYEKALALSKTAFGPEHLMTSDILAYLGSLYIKVGKYDKAEPYALQSLKIREPRVGKDHIAIADNLCDLGEVERHRRQYRKAEGLFLRALDIREKKAGKEHIEVGDACARLGLLYRDVGLYARAEPFYLRSLRIWQKQSPEGTRTAEVQLGLGKLYKIMAEYAKAEALYLQAQKIYLAREAPNSLSNAQVLSNLAEIYRHTGRFQEAEKACKEALAYRKSRTGEESYLVASSLHELGLICKQVGRNAEAVEHLKKAVAITEKVAGPDDAELATSIGVLATVYDDMGQFANAEKLYRQSLAAQERKLGPDHPDLGFNLSNLASLYSHMGRFTEAETLLLRSLRIREDKLGREHPDTATSRNNLAVLYLQTGQNDKAETMLRQVLQVMCKTHGEDNPVTATVLNNLALACERQGQTGKARELLEATLKMRIKNLGEEHRDVAIALNNLAGHHNAAGNYTEAEPLFRRAIAILEKVRDPNYHELALPLNNLALLLAWTGRGKEAEPLFRRSMAILAAVSPDHPTLAMPASNLAGLFVKEERWPEAADLTDQALHVVRRYVSRVLPTLSEQEQLAFLQTEYEKNYWSALSLGLLRPADARLAALSAGWVVNGKAVAHQALAERVLLARDSQDPNVGQAVQELLAIRKQLAALTFNSPPAEPPSRQAEQRRMIEKLSEREQQLTKFVGRVGGWGQGGAWTELDDVRKGLPKGSVFIDVARLPVFHFTAKGNEKFWQPARYVAWIVPAEGEGTGVKVIDLGEADAIEAAVKAARKPLQEAVKLIRKDGEADAESECRKVLAELARLVLQPLLPHVGKTPRWVLSPDASLWLVPWAALPLDNDTYVVEKHKLSYVTSGRDLVTGPARVKTGQAVIVADPDFDLAPGSARAATGEPPVATTRSVSISLELPEAPRLPGTAAEAAAILPSLRRYTGQEVKVFQDDQALEAVVKNLHSPRVLAVSTHGFFLQDQEVAPPERVGGEQREPVKTRDGKAVENPLLRCGLLLAGCNQRGKAKPGQDEDGVLTGLEIVGLDLRGTELVALSACETGLGKVRNGEGVAGLRQAFQLAGAQSVIATLWLIPDTETARLMNVFYDQLAQGKSRCDALREAQLFLIQSRRDRNAAAHPFFWAAFTLTGRSDDFQPVPEAQTKLATAEEYYQRGRKHEQDQQLDLALADYTQALRLDPKLARAWRDRGWINNRKGMPDKALADYAEAIRLEPGLATAWSERGYVRLRQNEYDQAIADLSRALELDAKLPTAYLHRGDAYRYKKEYDKAAADYGEAIKLKPNNPLAHNARGLVYAARDRQDEAIADYSEALKLDPKHLWAWANRGQVYERRKEYAMALADYDEALKLDPKYVFALNRRGLTLAAQEKYDLAIRDYTAALQVSPTAVYLHENRGLAHYNRGEYAQAGTDLSAAIRLDPKDQWAYGVRGMAYGNSGRWDEADADFARAVELNPADARAGTRRATLSLRAGDTEAYRKHCQALLERFAQTKDGSAANSVAWTCLVAPDAVADLGPVLRLVEKAVQLRPKDPFPLGTLVAALYRAGKHEEAVQRLTEAIGLHGKGGNTEDWLFLAMAEHKLGRPDAARKWQEKAVGWLDETAAAKVEPGKPPALSWLRQVELKLLRKETEALLK